MRRASLALLWLCACDSKPRRPPTPVIEERALPVAVPDGTVELGLRPEPASGGTALLLIVRRGATERRARVDFRPEVTCAPGLRSLGDLEACVADEVAWRLVPATSGVELRWARSAGGPETTVERVALAGAHLSPLR